MRTSTSAYGGLNGDRYNRGRRLFETGALRLWPELSVAVFATQAFDTMCRSPIIAASTWC